MCVSRMRQHPKLFNSLEGVDVCEWFLMQWFEEFPRARLSLKLCVFRGTLMKNLDVVMVNAMTNVGITDAAASEALQFIRTG